MTKDEALKMAYDWLNEYAPPEVVQACKEALKQPAQEPVAFRHKTTGEFCTGGFELKHLDQWTPLYTQPAPTWQRLSDDDIDEADNECTRKCFENTELIKNYDLLFARAIEQALKEKNT